VIEEFVCGGKMKIVIFVGGFPPTALAGTELASYNIANCLAKRGHEVHVITSGDPNLPEEYQEQGFFVHRILEYSFKEAKIRIIGHIYNQFAWRFYPFFYPFFYKYVVHFHSLSLIKKIQPDIIHIQQIEMGLYGFFPKLFLKIPYVVYARGIDFSDINGFIEKRQLKIALRKANALILLTDSMRKKFADYYHGPVYIIPNGIEMERFNNHSKEAARQKFGVGCGEKIILYVGRLRDYKGIMYLISAMSKISRNDSTAKLVVVGGDQGEKQNVERMIEELSLQEKIDLVGEKSPEDVLDYMVSADIFVLPSLREGFPNVFLEAMGSGLPIVSTNVDGLPEIIADGINGFLVPPKNADQLADKVCQLLSDTELREKISKHNLVKIKQFDINVISEQLEKIYSIYA
jgi:glycosyltransferase involved in cell wall biosynthesis